MSKKAPSEYTKNKTKGRPITKGKKQKKVIKLIRIQQQQSNSQGSDYFEQIYMPDENFKTKLENEVMQNILNFCQKMNLQKGFCFIQGTRKQLNQHHPTNKKFWSEEDKAKWDPQREQKSLRELMNKKNLKFSKQQMQKQFFQLIYQTSCIFDLQASIQFFDVSCSIWKILENDDDSTDKGLKQLQNEIKNDDTKFPVLNMKILLSLNITMQNYEKSLPEFLKNFKQTLMLLKNQPGKLLKNQ